MHPYSIIFLKIYPGIPTEILSSIRPGIYLGTCTQISQKISKDSFCNRSTGLLRNLFWYSSWNSFKRFYRKFLKSSCWHFLMNSYISANFSGWIRAEILSGFFQKFFFGISSKIIVAISPEVSPVFPSNISSKDAIPRAIFHNDLDLFFLTFF